MNLDMKLVVFLAVSLQELAEQVPAAKTRVERILIDAQTMACCDGGILGSVAPSRRLPDGRRKRGR